MGFLDFIDPFGLTSGIKGLGASEEVYGRKPVYQPAPTPGELLGANITANVQNQPQAQGFAGSTNLFNLGQLQNLFGKTAPGVYDANKARLFNIQSGLEGELSQPTLDTLKRSGAEWGMTSGTGAPMAGNQAGNRTLRDLGRSVEDRQSMAGRELESLLASMRRDLLPPLSDPSQFTLRPSYDPYAEDQRLIDIAKIAAAPVPSVAGAAAAQQALIESLLAVYSGSPKSGSADPSNYGTSWPGGYGSGGGGNPSNIPGTSQGAFEGTGEGGFSRYIG